MRKYVLILITVVFTARAQTPHTFEVATIKPSDPGAQRVSIGTGPGGRFLARNIGLKALIAEAYNVHDDRIIGSETLDTKRFDIEAKPPMLNPPFEQTRLMLQSLLAERFKLTFHRETRQMPAYFLSVEKSGSKMRPTRAPQDTDDETGIRRDGRGKLTGLKASVKLLADAIARDLGRSVVDETGLDGYYEFTLEWTDQDLTGPSIFTALHEQLGLKLEERKSPSEVIVIDRIETTPTAN